MLMGMMLVLSDDYQLWRALLHLFQNSRYRRPANDVDDKMGAGLHAVL